MRFKHVEPRKPLVNDLRHQDGFLLRPKRIMDETRFLEYAIWEEKYLELTSEEAQVWVPVRWINE